MPPEEPSWWYDNPDDWRRLALSPVSSLVALAAARRMRRPPRFVPPIPVVCVGNFVAGGSGKTPIVRAIAARLAAMGHRPAVLSRGYGGRLSGPLWVDRAHHGASDVGDEPWMLADEVPVMVSRHRDVGARAILAGRPDTDAIVMDDGLQNPALAKRLSLAVVDAGRGLGNGTVLPAGPLRAPVDVQLARVDALVFTHAASAAATKPEMPTPLQHFSGPVLHATTTPAADLGHLRTGPVIAFAAIANPRRVFETARAAGLNVVQTVDFGDHHQFTDGEIADLERRASAANAKLVTTEKDYARLATGSQHARRLCEGITVLGVKAMFDDASASTLDRLLSGLFPGAQ